MDVHTAPYSVLRSTEELNSLASTWAFHNKERVYCKGAFSLLPRQGLAPALRKVNATQKKGNEKSLSDIGFQGTQQSHTPTKPSITLATSFRSHVPSTRAVPPSVLTKQSYDSQRHHSTMKLHLEAMVLIEEQIISMVANMFLKQASTHSSVKLKETLSDQDLSVRSSCVTITGMLHKKPLHVFIPIVPPTREQIQKCKDDSVYHKNLITNIVSAVPAHLVNVVVSSRTHQETHNTIYIDANPPLVILGSTEVCNDLLFGDHRITSSANFWLDHEMSKNYSAAVCKYQTYNNIGIGSNITLTPCSHKRIPLVLSLSCPEFKKTSVVCTMSACKSHPKYGPNHTTKIVEIMSKVTPFVKKCSELYMNLTSDVREQMLEDEFMPCATSAEVQHSFCSNTSHGISSYVAVHTFILPVGMLNTYIMDTSDSRETFPMEKKIRIYVSAIYGEVPTEAICEDINNEV